MRYIISLFLVLLAFWAFNSEHYSLFFLFWALASIFFVLFIACRMALVDQETQSLSLYIHIIPFFFWLTKEVIIGSIYVSKAILLGKKAISPTITLIKINFKNELSKVIFANSVSLIPGTLSLHLSGETLQVHSLTRELADKLSSGKLARRVARLES